MSDEKNVKGGGVSEKPVDGGRMSISPEEFQMFMQNVSTVFNLCSVQSINQKYCASNILIMKMCLFVRVIAGPCSIRGDIGNVQRQGPANEQPIG